MCPVEEKSLPGFSDRFTWLGEICEINNQKYRCFTPQLKGMAVYVEYKSARIHYDIEHVRPMSL